MCFSESKFRRRKLIIKPITMAEFDLSDLEKINSKQEIIDILVDHNKRNY